MSPKCDDCGKFMSANKGWSWAHIYDMAGWSGLEREHYRCHACTDSKGPAQSNAKPHDGDMRPYQGMFCLLEPKP